MGPNYSPTFLVYGDFGLTNAQSLPRIQDEVKSGKIDAILHIGDIAYNLFEVSKLPKKQSFEWLLLLFQDDGILGDNFMSMLEDVTTQLPYMTLPGNHESSQYVVVLKASACIS